MIHEKLLKEFDQIDEEMFHHSTRYLLEVVNSSKYSSSLRDWFKSQTIHHLIELEQSAVENLYDELPRPSEIDDNLRTAISYKSQVIPYLKQKPGFGKLCLIRIFYYGLDYFLQKDVPLTWERFNSHLDERENSPYPLDKLPFLNYEYHPVTISAAQNLVAEWTSNHDYYKKVESWFKRGKHNKLAASKRGNLPNDFPYDIGSSYLEIRKNTPKCDWDYFTDLCRQLAFNYYAEEFLELLLPFDHGIKTRPSGIETVENCPLEISVDWAMAQDFTAQTQITSEKLLEEIQECIDHSSKHFRKVENEMNTLDAYKDVPSANVQLIHGKPADKYTEAELMGLIRNARKSQEDIKDLVETSKRVKSKHEALEANIAIYVAALDALSE